MEMYCNNCQNFRLARTAFYEVDEKNPIPCAEHVCNNCHSILLTFLCPHSFEDLFQYFIDRHNIHDADERTTRMLRACFYAAGTFSESDYPGWETDDGQKLAIQS